MLRAAVRRPITRNAAALALAAALSWGTSARAASSLGAAPRFETPGAWLELGGGGIRGITLGPIENARHPGKGYGTEASARALDEARAMGANWISLTPFGRVWDLKGRGIDLSFEAPFEDNRAHVIAAIAQAHARGLRVLVVPHLWVETGGWRAEIDPGDDAAWSAWTAAYRQFVMAWAEVARDARADMLSVGVELRSWVTTRHASSFIDLVRDVRTVFPGPLTYSANWDDVEATRVLDELDLIGINAFYPLAEHERASIGEMRRSAMGIAERLAILARGASRPIVLTEIGYTTRADPALRPWEWPDSMQHVVVDERAQADAYAALLAPFLDAPWCAGFFAWRFYADPDDVSQEAEWGFSPRGKLAELVLRDAFTARWAVDGPGFVGEALGRHRARRPGLYGWDLDALEPDPR